MLNPRRLRCAFQLILVAVLLSACEFRESLVINPDGSADHAYRIVIERETLESELVGGDWDELNATIPERRANYLRGLPLFSLMSPQAVIELYDDSFGLVQTTAIDNILEHEYPAQFSLLSGSITSFDEATGTWYLSGDGPAALARMEAELERLGNVAEGDAVIPARLELSLTLPGTIIEHDAHERDGNTLLWSWTAGKPPTAGYSASWTNDDRVLGQDPNDRFVQVQAATAIGAVLIVVVGLIVWFRRRPAAR